MQRAINPQPVSLMNESSDTFSVLALYEDLGSGKHARRTYQLLVDNLEEECECALHMWSFDVLAIPALRQAAGRDAKTADIILISSRGGRELPATVLGWMEDSIATGMRALAIVGLLDPSSRDTSCWPATCQQLAQAARRAGMEFFAQPDLPPAGMLQELSDENGDLTKVGGLLDAVAVSSRDRGTNIPHWGINE
jgi:hypothetical protein